MPYWITKIENAYNNCVLALKKVNYVLENKDLTEENRKELENKKESIQKNVDKFALKLKKAKESYKLWIIKKEFEENPFISAMKSWEDDSVDTEEVRKLFNKFPRKLTRIESLSTNIWSIISCYNEFKTDLTQEEFYLKLDYQLAIFFKYVIYDTNCKYAFNVEIDRVLDYCNDLEKNGILSKMPRMTAIHNMILIKNQGK